MKSAITSAEICTIKRALLAFLNEIFTVEKYNKQNLVVEKHAQFGQNAEVTVAIWDRAIFQG
jgi:hypothetical protein